MIVLDTNVVSELVRSEPDGAVRRWLADQRFADLSVTTITLFEVQFGLKLMPFSANRRRVEKMLSDILAASVFGRIVPFDIAAAERAADIRALRRMSGREVGIADCMIAGIVLEHGASLATRNVRDFDGVGLPLINPWEFGS